MNSSQKTSLEGKIVNPYYWQGESSAIEFELAGIKKVLLDIEQSVHVLQAGGRIGVTKNGFLQPLHNEQTQVKHILTIPPLPIEQLGDRSFKKYYGTQYAYYAGAMAHAISSEEMIIQMGKKGFLASFGAGGVTPARVERAIQHIKSELPQGPYAFNLIFNPNEPSLERKVAELYLQHEITTVEASAFLDITLPLVLYRIAGLSQHPDGSIHSKNRIIAKLSRKEVATRFMQPAPQDILDQLIREKKITEMQVRWAQQVPLADDITVEADSGGHTDNRPLVCLLPAMFTLRDEMQHKHAYQENIRIGAAGGISTPASALAAFMMGADYVGTGSINQSCIEAGSSEHTRNLLSQADMTEVAMAPAADMFEMGVRVQVLKRGTMFPMRAQRLYELYKTYDSIEAIPVLDRDKLEKQIFRSNLDEIWNQTVKFFGERDPAQVQRAEKDAKYKMALIFRWYLGLSSHWSNYGEKGREMDYQIWCGPSMGAFNDWVRGSYLEQPQNRHVVEVARQILTGAAYLSRIQLLKMNSIEIPVGLFSYQPVPL